MATLDKEENKSSFEEQSSNSLVSDDNHSPRDYNHNPEEFIDIHRDHRQQQESNSGSPDLHGAKPPKPVNTVVKTDLVESMTNTDSEFVNSLSGPPVIKNLKVPVQVSEENEIKNNSDTNLKNSSDSSDEEYQSADEGDGNENKHDSEEDDSEDECIPVGDEDEYERDQRTFCKNDNASVFDGNESGDKESENEEKESNIIDDMEVRKNLEEKLTEEEIQARKEKGQKLKDDGNAKFRNGDYDEAICDYTAALDICPLNFHKERSIMFANRAACKMKKEQYEGAIQDSTSALDLHPHYLKALQRRADLYEKTEKLDEALTDYQKLVELDPSQGMARAACMRLAEQIKDRNEKMKEEMIGKLKDLGNLVLRPFGLSVNNFNLQKDPNTGSYSVQFQQNSSNNGS